MLNIAIIVIVIIVLICVYQKEKEQYRNPLFYNSTSPYMILGTQGMSGVPLDHIDDPKFTRCIANCYMSDGYLYDNGTLSPSNNPAERCINYCRRNYHYTIANDKVFTNIIKNP